MTNKIVKVQSLQAPKRVRELVKRLILEDPDSASAKRKRLMALLKSQCGYTNEKAVGEMERLLKQFHSMNLSLGIYRTRPNFKQTPAE